MAKCEMARHKYCNQACFGECMAEDRELDRCPYLQAIGEIARLSVENNILEKRLEDYNDIR